VGKKPRGREHSFQPAVRQRAGRDRSLGKSSPGPLACPRLAQPVAALPATAAGRLFPRRFPAWPARCGLASSSLLQPPSSAPAPDWLAAPQWWRWGALATGLPPPLPPRPPQPPPAPHCRSDHVVGDFHRGSGAGPGWGARGGAGRVGGVKVGAQQNPPQRAPCGQTSAQVVASVSAAMLPKVLLTLLNVFMILQSR
jgi:hypothetical protein